MSRTAGKETKNERYIETFFPQLAERTYRVPAVFFQSEKLESKGEYQTRGTVDPAVIRGEGAEKRFCDVLESMKIFNGSHQPMVIISGYKFQNCMCNLNNESDVKHYQSSERKGEHDVLLLHLEHGVTFFQVKSIEDFKKTDGENLKRRKDKHGRKVQDCVKMAIEQLNRDVSFFTDVTKDLRISTKVRMVVVLPNITRKYLNKLDATKSVLEYEDLLNSCICADEIPTAEDKHELREEKINNFKRWWENNIVHQKGFDYFEDYKQIIGRYCGPVSVVGIPTTNVEQAKRHGKVQARTEGEALAELGYRHMRIILTPELEDILNSDEKRLVIKGDCGTGKTILLILKARAILKRGGNVCLSSGIANGMSHYLYQAVVAGLDTLKDKVKVFHEEDMKTVLQYVKDTSSNLFYDETRYTYFGKDEYNVADYLMSVDAITWFVKAPNQIIKSEYVNFDGFQEVSCNIPLRRPERIQNLLKYGDMINFHVIDHNSHKDIEYYECKECIHDAHNIFTALGLNTCDQDIEQTSKDVQLNEKIYCESKAACLSDPRLYLGETTSSNNRGYKLEGVESKLSELEIEGDEQKGHNSEAASWCDLSSNGPKPSSYSRLEESVKAVPESKISWSDVLIASPDNPPQGDFLRRLGINCVVNSAIDGDSMFETEAFLGHTNQAIATCSIMPVIGIERKVVFCLVNNQSGYILTQENLDKFKRFISRSTSHVIFLISSKCDEKPSGIQKTLNPKKGFRLLKR